MNKRSLLLVLLAFLLIGTSASAQTKSSSQKKSTSGGSKSSGGSSGYQTGIGLRGGGYASGLTIKHFMSGKNNVAVEGLVTTEYQARGVRFTLLFEKHKQLLSDVRNLQFYYGGGLHAGAYRGRYYYITEYRYDKKGRVYYSNYYVNDRDKTYPVFGADLILGLEYKIPELPLVIGADYKPYFDIFDGNTGFYHDAALSVRIAF
jgi:hypothetical protein